MKRFIISIIFTLALILNIKAQKYFDVEIGYGPQMGEIFITLTNSGNIIQNETGDLSLLDSLGNFMFRQTNPKKYLYQAVTNFGNYFLAQQSSQFSSGAKVIDVLDDSLNIVYSIQNGDCDLSKIISVSDGFLWYGINCVFKYNMQGELVWTNSLSAEQGTLKHILERENGEILIASTTEQKALIFSLWNALGKKVSSIQVHDNFEVYDFKLLNSGMKAGNDFLLVPTINFWGWPDQEVLLFDNTMKVKNQMVINSSISDAVESYDGGIVLVGVYDYSDMFFARIDSSFKLIMDKILGTQYTEHATQIVRAPNMRYSVLGYYFQDYYEARYNCWYFNTDSAFTLPTVFNYSVDPRFQMENTIGKFLDLDNNDSLYFISKSFQLYKLGPNGTYDTQNDFKTEYDFETATFPPYIIDIDNDGDNDLVFSTGKNFKKNSICIKNEKEGFKKDTSVIIPGDFSFTNEFSWVDINGDGYLDYYKKQGDGRQVYVFDGVNSFSEASNVHLVKNQSWSFYDWVDIDYDRDMDLCIIIGPPAKPFIYTNNGQGAFKLDPNHIIRQVDVEPLAQHWKDFNNDGYTDAFFPYYANSPFFSGYSGVFSQKNKGGLNKVSTESYYYDFDNDGDLDIFSPHKELDWNSYNRMYRNDGVAFSECWYFPVKDVFIDDNQFQIYDFDKNGSLDFYIPREHPNSVYKSQILPCENEVENWVKIKLIGQASNINGIHSKILLKSTTNNKILASRTLEGKESVANVGFTEHIGIGKTELIDSVVILWPSGCRQVLEKIKANQTIVITENCCGSAIKRQALSHCRGEVFSYSTNQNNRLKFYKEIHDTLPFFEGAIFETDTLVHSQIVFVSNADSLLDSRKSPLIIDVVPYINVKTEIILLNNSLEAVNLSENFDSAYWELGDGTFVYDNLCNHIYSDTGNFRLRLHLKNACFAETIDTVLKVRIENVNAEYLDKEIRIFPNPITDKLRVVLPFMPIESKIYLNVYNFNGQIIIDDFLLNKLNNEIRFGFPNGVYVYTISANKNVVKKGQLLKL